MGLFKSNLLKGHCNYRILKPNICSKDFKITQNLLIVNKSRDILRILYTLCCGTVLSNHRSACRMWPDTAFSVGRGSIQEKSSNLKLVEKRERLHLSLCISCAG